MDIKEDCSQDCELKVGDKVKFTKDCGYKDFHEMGVIGIVDSIKESLPYPYSIDLSQESYDILVKHQKILCKETETRFDWLCKENEIELA